MLEQKENFCVESGFSWRSGCALVLVKAVLTQDKALRKRNLSGGGTSQLSDSTTAPVNAGVVFLSVECHSTRVPCEKLSGLKGNTLLLAP